MRHSVTEAGYLESAMEVSGEDYCTPKSRGDGNSENRITCVAQGRYGARRQLLQTVKALKNHKTGRRSLRHSKTAGGQRPHIQKLLRSSDPLLRSSPFERWKRDPAASYQKAALATVFHTVPVMIAMGILIVFGVC